MTICRIRLRSAIFIEHILVTLHRPAFWITQKGVQKWGQGAAELVCARWVLAFRTARGLDRTRVHLLKLSGPRRASTGALAKRRRAHISISVSIRSISIS